MIIMQAQQKIDLSAEYIHYAKGQNYKVLMVKNDCVIYCKQRYFDCLNSLSNTPLLALGTEDKCYYLVSRNLVPRRLINAENISDISYRLFLRPLDNFLAQVEKDGVKVPRFRKVKPF